MHAGMRMERDKQYQLNIQKPLHLSSAMLCLDIIPPNCTWDCFVEVHAIENGQDHLIGIIGTGLTMRYRDSQSNPISLQCMLNLKIQPTSPVALYIKVIGIPYYTRGLGAGLFGKELGKQNIAVQVTGYFD